MQQCWKFSEVNVMSIVAIVFLVGVALFLTLQAGAER
jgi:hypothetical protein